MLTVGLLGMLPAPVTITIGLIRIMDTETDEPLPDTSFVPAHDAGDRRSLDAVREAIVARRKELGMTEPDLARRLNTPLGRVRAFEAGTNEQVQVTSLQRYARAVGMRLTLDLEPLDDSTVDSS